MNRLGFFLILLLSFSASAEEFTFPTTWPLQGRTQLKTIWENGQPRWLVARWADQKGIINCSNPWPLGQYLGTLPNEWTDIESVGVNFALRGLLRQLTDAEKKDCITTNIPASFVPVVVTPPVPPVVTTSWKVAVNGIVLTRPMKNPDFTDMKERATVGEPCEPEVIKILNTKQSWHFTKSTTGVRGLAVCEL
jgi:hypothetical protein